MQTSTAASFVILQSTEGSFPTHSALKVVCADGCPLALAAVYSGENYPASRRELLPSFSGYSEEEGSKLLRHVGIFVPEYTV
jgi:hypothetical protein